MYVAGKPSALYDSTNPDWAPSLQLGHNKVTDVAAARDTDRHQRVLGRKRKKLDIDAASVLVELQDAAPEIAETATETGMASQTELHSTTIAAMQTEIQQLLSENLRLKTDLQVSIEKTKLERDFFKENDEKVKYYTGLPDFSTLNFVYESVEPFCSISNVLSKFQQLILCLLKLRLNLSHMDLGHRFGVNKSTSSRIYLNMIDILYNRLQHLIIWPEREELKETMPMSLRVHFGTKVVVIIDCFDVFLERPSNIKARRDTWSSYKHNNTVKFLIGITPQGNVSYLSKGWGGRTSDKYITEHCNILSKLNPGDIVLADRGFDIADSVARMGAELKIPAFTKGKKQLSGVEVESTRRIANVRIHVERVIGSLRQKYSVLQSTLPLQMMAQDGGR